MILERGEGWRPGEEVRGGHQDETETVVTGQLPGVRTSQGGGLSTVLLNICQKLSWHLLPNLTA